MFRSCTSENGAAPGCSATVTMVSNPSFGKIAVLSIHGRARPVYCSCIRPPPGLPIRLAPGPLVATGCPGSAPFWLSRTRNGSSRALLPHDYGTKPQITDLALSTAQPRRRCRLGAVVSWVLAFQQHLPPTRITYDGRAALVSAQCPTHWWPWEPEAQNSPSKAPPPAALARFLAS
jgi:hypothetical protein